jgi:hypothetical protein
VCVYVCTYVYKRIYAIIMCKNVYVCKSFSVYSINMCARVCARAAELVLKYKHGFVASLRNVVSLWFVLA